MVGSQQSLWGEIKTANQETSFSVAKIQEIVWDQRQEEGKGKKEEEQDRNRKGRLEKKASGIPMIGNVLSATLQTQVPPPHLQE